MNKTEAVIISHSNLTSSIWYSDPPGSFDSIARLIAPFVDIEDLHSFVLCFSLTLLVWIH